MANTKNYYEKTIQKIQDYLNGDITDAAVSQWALDVIVETKQLGKLPEKVLSAIQCLVDLHDQGESWCPTREELERWKAELEKETENEN